MIKNEGIVSDSPIFAAFPVRGSERFSLAMRHGDAARRALDDDFPRDGFPGWKIAVSEESRSSRARENVGTLDGRHCGKRRAPLGFARAHCATPSGGKCAVFESAVLQYYEYYVF